MSFVRRRWWLMLLGVFAAVVAAGVAGYVAHSWADTYKSTAVLLVVDDGERLPNTYAQMAGLRTVRTEVISRLNMQLSEDELAKKLDVRTQFNSKLIWVTAEDGNRNAAANLANATAEAFVEEAENQVGRPDTVKLVESAIPPENPSNPSPVKTAGIAGILGLLVAAGVLVGVESVSRERQAVYE